MSVDEFYKKTGIATGYFRSANKKIRDNGSKKDINFSTITKVLDNFNNANPDYFFLGKGGFFLDENAERHEIDTSTISEDSHNGRPYYAIDFINSFDNLFNKTNIVPTSYINIEEYNKDSYFWVNLTGHSMHPVIQSGDKICICEIKDISSIIYGEIYAIVTEKMRTVKYVTRSEQKDCLRLVPENKSPRYGDYQDIPLSNIRKIYRVVGSIHTF